MLSKKEFEERYNELTKIINERRKQEPVENNGKEMSLYDYSKVINEGLYEYNYRFKVELNNYQNTINRKHKILNFFGQKLPLIQSIVPVVLNDGTCRIDMYLMSGNDKYAGIATIHDDLSFQSTVLRSIDENKTNEFLSENVSYFTPYFVLLEKFTKEYPGISFEWNLSNDNKSQKVKDDLFSATITLDRIPNVLLSLSNPVDFEISKSEDLCDDIDNCYKSELIRTIKVDVDDFNPLFKEVYKKSLEKKESLNQNPVTLSRK